MLFDKNRHHPLIESKWNKVRAQEVLNNIVDDAVNSYNPETGWPCHPMDEFGGNDLYMGTSGVFLAIVYLEQAGAISTNFDIVPFLENQITESRETFKEFPHPNNCSYLCGDLPILMLQFKFSKDKSTADIIFNSIQKNNSQPVRELMWGIAGTMISAIFMEEWTSELRWKDIFIYQANRLLSEWEPISGIGHLWSPELYGGNKKYLGPVHGFAGNLIPLIKGRRFLPDEQFKQICVKAMETTINTAVTSQKFANWNVVFGQHNDPKLVQHCHGAPGIITALSDLPQDENIEFDRILEKAGEFVWFAGPLQKGSNLCHGTGGNGYSFLKLFQRTQNEIWLDRARLFAMHAIEQYTLSKELYGQGRHTLWTGDLGLAVYLWDCLQEQAKFPSIDVF